MSIKYIEEHDVCFWKKTFGSDGYTVENPTFAWDDWGLIPTSRPYISVPKANYVLAQIPNSSNRINITNFMPGGMTYESRTGEWQFAIDHTKKLWKNWYDGYYAIEKYFHGSKMIVSLNEDQTKLYDGRISISAYDPGDNYSTITLSYDFDAMPLDDTTISNLGMMFRVRYFDYNGKVIFTDYAEINTFYGAGYGYVDGKKAVPKGSTFSGWTPSAREIDGNTDFRPKYYFPIIATTPHGVPASNASVSGGMSAHPIQFILNEDEEVIERKYEIPDTVKFLFNNVDHAIDFMGSQGKTIKRVWFSPENLDFETNA